MNVGPVPTIVAKAVAVWKYRAGYFSAVVFAQVGSIMPGTSDVQRSAFPNTVLDGLVVT